MKQSPVTKWVAEKTGLGERLSPSTLEEYQFARLRELLDYAQRKSRHYQKVLGHIDVHDITCRKSLSTLPFSTADDLRRDSSSFVCVPQQEVVRIVTLFTSGTSGVSKRIYFSDFDQELCVDFFACGMRTMVSSGDTVNIFLGGTTPGGTVDLLRRGLEWVGVTPRLCGFPEDPGVPNPLLTDADCFIGLPVHMHQMAKVNPDLRPKSVLLCADYVAKPIIESLKQTWRCNVYAHYGSTESGLGGGVECAGHSGYHLRDADLLVEIVDPATGIPVPHGLFGEVVITTLNRQAMPLIRYRTGDRSRFLTSPCPCGGKLHRLDTISGRYSNLVPLNCGALISIHMIDEIIFQLPEVLDYSASLLFGDSNVLRLSVRTHKDFSAQKISAFILDKLNLPLTIKVDKMLTPPPGDHNKRRIWRG